MPNLFQPTALVGAIALAMGFSATASAQDSINASLDTLVVTATRSEEKIKDVPARIAVISKSDIEKNPALNLNDLVKQDAALNVVQTGGLGQTTSIFTRGTNSNHTLVLKDGAALIEGINGKNNTELLDLSDVGQIEILKGPASVQYGSDAIGGVIQLLTDTPEKNSAFITGLYGENNTYKALVGLDLAQDGFFAQIRGQRLESDGTEILNTQNNDQASYDQKGYSAKIGYKQDNFKTNVSISENEGINHYLDYSTGTNTAKRDFKNQLINWNGLYQFTDALTLNARYSNYQDEATYIETYSYAYDSERNEGDINLNWKFTPKQNILFGVSTQDTDVTYDYLSGKKNLGSTGYYLQHQYNNAGIHTQAGIRLEDDDQFGQHTVGQIAGRLQIAPLTSVYANIGSAFKAPTAYQLYAGFYGNQDLKPEESISYEIGLDQQFNYGLSANASVYYTKVKNLIGSNASWQYVNIDDANMTGGELGLNWKKDQLFTSAEYAYVKTEDESTGFELVRRPRQTFTFTAGYDDGTYGVNTALVARSHAKAQASQNSVKIPGYATIDLNAFWNVNPNIKLFTNIQNIGDVKYKAVYSSTDTWYINGGRFASAGVTFRY
ncbi:ligand-gated channel protein [Acinetobacter sp. ANC 4204]|uniref:TonB-dependent receptor plug domain-containing protein n=1 Tax=unclassified Acinetobacter TaxID=196816 RepID=UPI000A34176E|nr:MULTISPECIES: TonB-dependent receptor [unclassified Acinetobacter]OTG56828.1 ligand-gated channel protein [Acinetobacter sp. ANC 4204]RGD88798.1 TonB-dependent receptor [Acinetobacter sp. SWAC57]